MIDQKVKTHLGFAADAPDDDVMRTWKEASSRVCKPCWDLKYCPYGPLVEDSPLLPPTKAMSLDWYEHLKRTLETGQLPGGEPLDETRRRYLEKSVAEFNLEITPAKSAGRLCSTPKSSSTTSSPCPRAEALRSTTFASRASPATEGSRTRPRSSPSRGPRYSRISMG